MLTVIRDTAGNHYIVSDSTAYGQAFVATPAKKTKAGFVPKANAKERLVRKDGCELVPVNIHDFNDILLERQYMRTAEFKRKAAMKMHQMTPVEIAAHNAKDAVERAARDAADPHYAAHVADMREIEREVAEWRDEQERAAHERSLRNPS